MSLAVPSSYKQTRRAHVQRVLRIALGPVLILVFLLPLFQARSLALAGSDPDTLGTARTVPSWMDKAIFYEIFPRAFSPAGTLNGVTAKLDTLQKLGVNVLWLMPIHPIGQVRRVGTYGSVYAVRDYYAVDPDLGTKDDLLHFVQAAHARHMRVILDEVPDHTAWDNAMMTHPHFYKHDAGGHIISPHDWTDVAALNYDDPALRKYMVDMYAYWLKTFDLDGFRCDDAADVPTSFWEEVRTRLQQIQPDVLLLAEASKPELLRQAFDIDYAWPLLYTFDDVMLEGKPASAIRDQVAAQEKLFPKGSWHMLVSDDHDTQRATVRFGAPAALAASALVFTLPGAPLLYNGMETGDATPSSGPALFEKLPIFWGAAQLRPAFPEFYHALIPLRENSPALRHGELIWLHNSGEDHVLTYLRRCSEETDLIAVNLSSNPFTGTVEVASGGWQEVDLNADDPAHPRHDAHPQSLAPVALPAISLAPFEARIFRNVSSH